MMNTDKKVSIVIPTFNRSDKVVRAIDTALAQTYPCEVVVIDHGSSDNTPEIVGAYGDKVNYIRRETDFGPHFCWLEGIMHAKGEYVNMLLDDDWLDPTFIEKSMALMSDDVGVVFANASIVFEEEGKMVERHRLLSNFKTIPKETGVHSNKLLEKACIGNSFMPSPTACIYRRKDMIDALYQGSLPVDVYPEYHGVGPDHFLTLLTLLRYKNFGFVNEPIVFFFGHEGSITIDAHANQEKAIKLKNAYINTRIFYLYLKSFNIRKSSLRLRVTLSSNVAAKTIRRWIIQVKVKKEYKIIRLLGIYIINTKG